MISGLVWKCRKGPGFVILKSHATALPVARQIPLTEARHGSNRIFGHLGGCSRPINNSAADRRGRKGTFTPPYNIMSLLTFTLGICAAGSPKRPKKLRKALTGFPSDTYLLASAAATSNPVKKTKHSDSYLGIGWRSAQNLKGSPMAWFFTVVILIVAAFLVILFLNRYYRKATREISVVRTGMGGQKVVLDGGCLALPFLHKVAEVNMRVSIPPLLLDF